MIEQFLAYAMRRRNDDGASAVEYGLLVALIAALIVGVVAVLGGTIQDAFDKTNDCVANSKAAECNPAA